MSGYQDDYDISRLLLSRANTRWPFNEGKVILYAPSHSICLVTNDATAETLNALVKCGDEAASNQRLFSQRFWTLNDGGDWVRYENSEDQEIAKIISLQNYTEDTTNYADQKAIIKKLYEISSTDVFVSDYVAYATEDDRLVSSCTYALHVPTLLPRTDTVAIYDYENDTVIAMVDWEEFSSLLSDNMQMSNDYIPARYAVLNQIPDEVINQLKQAKSNTR